MRDLTVELERRRSQHLYRKRRLVEDSAGVELLADGKKLVNFCSNDYLGLAQDPRLQEAFIEGAKEYGVGAGAAHLVTGHTAIHHQLEEALADFTGRPRALLFSTGYMANLGVVSALMGRSDTLFEDRLNHASLIDAGLMSRAGFKRYPHLDVTSLAEMMVSAKGQKLVISDGVFSMDGDVAPVIELAELCRANAAWLMIDDAHGIGVLGEHGGGLMEHAGMGLDDVPVLMGTLGKALGTFGAFVAGSEALIETLIQDARTYIYTTAPPPAVAAATLASLDIIKSEGWRRHRLVQLIKTFKHEVSSMGLELMPSDTPIQPVLAGSAEQALHWSQYLEEQGVLVTAIRPPTVPDGTARLRITFSTAHQDEHLDKLLSALSKLSGLAA